MAAEPAARPKIFDVLLPREKVMRPQAPHEMVVRPPRAPQKEELRLSDFDTICELGEGSTGVVTKVRHCVSGEVFALKTAYGPNAHCAGEAQVLRRCCMDGSPPLPHLVRCHAIFPGDSGEAVMLLELMEAGSLHGLLCRRRGLPEPAVAEVAARCLAALAGLHSRGVAHLDVKPDNLLANAGGDVKLGDFSLSKMFLGSERFAPDADKAEQLAAFAADVCGLGITILELFQGLGEGCSSPILSDEEDPSREMLVGAICSGGPPSVPASAGASAELRSFVAACLRRNLRRRATVAKLLSHPFVARRNVEASRRALWEVIAEDMMETHRAGLLMSVETGKQCA